MFLRSHRGCDLGTDVFATDRAGLARLLFDVVRAAAAQNVTTVKYLHEVLVLWIHLGRLNFLVADRTLALPSKLLDKLLEL